MLYLFNNVAQKHILSHHKLSISPQARGESVVFSCRTEKQNQEVCARLQPRMQPESPLSLQKQGASCGPAPPLPPPCPGPATPVVAYLRFLIRGHTERQPGHKDPQTADVLLKFSHLMKKAHFQIFIVDNSQVKTSLICVFEHKTYKKNHISNKPLYQISVNFTFVLTRMSLFIHLPVLLISVSVVMMVLD